MSEDNSRPNQMKVFKAIAEIMSRREGVKITVKSVSLKEEKQIA